MQTVKEATPEQINAALFSLKAELEKKIRELQQAQTTAEPTTEG